MLSANQGNNMTVKHRKEREKEQFVATVIQVAGKLMREGGLANLSLRKLATGLEYSTSKLYQVFKNKQDLLLFLGEEICQRQNNRFQYAEENANPEEALLKFMHDAVSFYAEEPWSAEILAAIEFNNEEKDRLPTFREASDNFTRYVAALNLPLLANPKSLHSGITMMRFLLMGALSILRPDSSIDEKKSVIKIVNDGMQVMLAGWKSLHTQGVSI